MIIYFHFFSFSEQCLLSFVVFVTADIGLTAPQNQYLPPNKGYNYDRPSVPFQPQAVKSFLSSFSFYSNVTHPATVWKALYFVFLYCSRFNWQTHANVRLFRIELKWRRKLKWFNPYSCEKKVKCILYYIIKYTK